MTQRTPVICGHCYGEERGGPAVARVRMRDWDDSTFTVDVCAVCLRVNQDETVRVLWRYDRNGVRVRPG